MQIEQVIGSVNGDTTAQAIQLRMRAAGQNFVSGGKLVVFDAAGLNPITVLNVASNVANGAVGDHVLIASATFPSHTTPAAVPDFTMANLIPASYFAAGSLMWQSDAGTVFWRLSWGGAAYTGPCTGATDNDVDGNFCPPFGGPLPSSCTNALEFQGNATDFSTNNAADYLLIGNASFVPLDPGKFSIKRVGCTDSDLTVFYAISGTARNGVDYRRLSGSATIRSGTPKAAITVKPIDDGIPGPDETVILTLSPDPSYTIGSRNSATVTIRNNK
ncbi:MAG: hypothetical protein DMF30_11700 [Verrucomicrobia bacterium]|nr:MAG: hypothetical protein DMF30_11700 [Verrucomicrobiota bacterium]